MRKTNYSTPSEPVANERPQGTIGQDRVDALRRAVRFIDFRRGPEDLIRLLLDMSSAPLIEDPVSQIDQLLAEAKAAPRFRNDTYDAVDRLDATMFGGDEFVMDKALRQHFRYYLARWEKQLRSFDEFDISMDGEEG